jgi:tripartite-type tricarboxylate transporter receptor subunit TctC
VQLLVAFLLLPVVGVSCAVPEASYPNRAVELVVPFPPGGVTDLAARAVAEQLSRKWGQPINVVNKPGGSGAIGTLAVLQAPADGYTMLAHSIGLTLLPAVQSTTPYSWDQLTPVGLVISNGLVFTVAPTIPWLTLREAADALRREPRGYAYAVGGLSGPQVFGLAQLFREAQVPAGQVQRVVMQGSGPALTAVAGGHVQFAAFNIPEAVDLIATGRIRALAVTTASRSPQLPGVPTAAEAGFPRFNQQSWNGISGPSGLPQQVLRKWDDGLRELAQDPAFVSTLENLGGSVDYRGPAEFKALVQMEYEQAQAAVEDLGLRE